MAYQLLASPTRIADAFDTWREALVDGAEWRGDSWWLPEERIAFRNRNDQLVPELGDFVVLSTDPTLASITVQLNKPQQFGNENPLSGIAEDEDGRLHLVRQGTLQENAVSPRINDDLFVQRTRLAPLDMRLEEAAARRSWFSVTALDLPGVEIRRNIAAFVELCSLARGQQEADEAAADDEHLEELFGKDETGGETKGSVHLSDSRRVRIQGEVWRELQVLLRADGRKLRKPRHARGYEVDGEIATSGGSLLLEIKTSADAADVYAGLGQLELYPKLLPRLQGHRRILLLPGLPSKPIMAALGEMNIDIHTYELARAGSRVEIEFSERFLRLCELTT